MGRYDKIKVYNNGSWHTPNRIRVYKNGWQDLGTNDSSNTKTLYVRHNNQFRRATLNKKTTTTITDKWAVGGFTALPENGFNSWPDKGRPFKFSIDSMKKTTNGSQVRIFHFWTSASGSYIKIVWDTDGYVRAHFSYAGAERTVTSSNAIGANQAVSFSIETWNNTYGAYATMYLNGVWAGGYVNSISYGSASNYVGDGNIQFRGNLKISGYDSGGGAHSISFNASDAATGSTSQYRSLTHQQTSVTTTTWE